MFGKCNTFKCIVIKRRKKKQQVNKLTSFGKWIEEPLPQRKWSDKEESITAANKTKMWRAMIACILKGHCTYCK